MLPVRLSINNFYSHEDSVVDFEEFSSCLIIGNTEGDYARSNGSGKSVIFESILWCLFNKSRASMMDDIVSWGKTSCSVELVFSHFNEDYKLLRSRNKVSSTSSVDLFRLDDSEGWLNISGSTAGLTNKMVEDLIGLDYKTFINSVYFRQNDISEFADSEPGRRKEILKSIIDISRWDEYERLVKSSLRDIKKESSSVEESISNYDLVLSDNATLKESLDSKKIELKSAESERATVDKLVLNLKEKYLKIKESIDTDSYDKVIEEISSLKKKGGDKKEKLDNINLLIKKYSDICDSCDLKIKNLSNKINNISYVEDISVEIDLLLKRISGEKSSLKASTKMKEHLDSMEMINGECYVCSQKISSSLHEHLVSKHSDRVDKCISNIDEHTLNIENAESNLDLKNNDLKNNNLVDEVNSEIKTLNLERSMAHDNLSSLKNDKEVVVSDLFKIKSDIEYNNKILDSLKNDTFQELSSKIIELKNDKAGLNSSVSSLSKDIGVLTEKIKVNEASIELMSKGRDKSGLLKKDLVLLERISKMLGKGGIQTILLDTIIEDLEVTSNKILNFICNEPAVISLETQRVGSDGSSVVETLDIKINIDGVSHGFKSLSGGEKFRIALALRIALSEVSNRHGNSCLELLLLDEVNSPLDRHGTETLFVNVIKSLESKYKVLIITHDESLKEKFDNVIDVTKVNGKSSIEFGAR